MSKVFKLLDKLFKEKPTLENLSRAGDSLLVTAVSLLALWLFVLAVAFNQIKGWSRTRNLGKDCIPSKWGI